MVSQTLYLKIVRVNKETNLKKIDNLSYEYHMFLLAIFSFLITASILTESSLTDAIDHPPRRGLSSLIHQGKVYQALSVA